MALGASLHTEAIRRCIGSSCANSSCPAGRYKDPFVDAVVRVIPVADWLPSADQPALQLPLWGLGEVVQDPGRGPESSGAEQV